MPTVHYIPFAQFMLTAYNKTGFSARKTMPAGKTPHYCNSFSAIFYPLFVNVRKTVQNPDKRHDQSAWTAWLIRTERQGYPSAFLDNYWTLRPQIRAVFCGTIVCTDDAYKLSGELIKLFMDANRRPDVSREHLAVAANTHTNSPQFNRGTQWNKMPFIRTSLHFGWASTVRKPRESEGSALRVLRPYI